MSSFNVKSIGKICCTEEGFVLEVEPEYIKGLAGLDGFSHVQVIWFFSGNDNPEGRAVLEVPRPYNTAPDSLGVFATRSPERPNPIALTTVDILHIDYEKGRIYVPYIDADDGSPILDLKPYIPSLDRVEKPVVPQWQAHWPSSVETSGDFDWESVFCWE